MFAAFLKLGLTSFGGPVAHLGYFRNELVVRRKWIDEVAYADLDDRFQESCHMGGIHLPFQAPIYGVEGFATKDLAIWRRGGGRLNCRSEIRIWRG